MITRQQLEFKVRLYCTRETVKKVLVSIDYHKCVA